MNHVMTNHKAAVVDAIVKENYTITKDIEATMLKLADEFTTSYTVGGAYHVVVEDHSVPSF